jgi:hypothetical protein
LLDLIELIWSFLNVYVEKQFALPFSDFHTSCDIIVLFECVIIFLLVCNADIAVLARLLHLVCFRGLSFFKLILLIFIQASVDVQVLLELVVSIVRVLLLLDLIENVFDVENLATIWLGSQATKRQIHLIHTVVQIVGHVCVREVLHDAETTLESAHQTAPVSRVSVIVAMLLIVVIHIEIGQL